MLEVNQVNLSGVILKIYPAFTTPSGINVVRFTLEHNSWQMEAASKRQVKCRMFCVWVGGQLSLDQVQMAVAVGGFIGTNSQKQLVLHVTNLKILD